MDPIINFLKNNWLNLVFILIGAYSSIIALRGFVLSYCSRNWQSTQGEVVQSYIETDKYDGTEYPRIQYVYNVDGFSYSSDNIYVWGNISGFSFNKSFVQKFSVGKAITVYFNPQNPKESCLKIKGGKFFLLIILIFGLFFFLINLLSLLNVIQLHE